MLPSKISLSGNIVAQLCWDNFDVTEQTRSGLGTTHSTHGIMIQEVEVSAVEVPDRLSLPRTRERSMYAKVCSESPSCLLCKD